MGEQKLSQPVRFKDRIFPIQEIELIQEITEDFASLGLNEISQTICELLGWQRPNGRLKNHECRLFLQELQASGLVSLPALRARGPRGHRQIRLSSRSEADSELTGSAGQWEPLLLEKVEAGVEGASGLWAEYIERYHYLGYQVPVGANLRYLVHSGKCPQQVLACLQFSSPAWKMAVRDRWIGWTDAQRRQNLQYIINNSRFLILPWVRVRGLASKILSRATRRLPLDWEAHYGYRPLLLETLVDSARFRGTCYRAANWMALGATQGRGRMDRERRAPARPKEIYVFPLVCQVQVRLCSCPPPGHRSSAGTNR